MRRILTIIVLIAIVAATGWTLFRWKATTTTAVDPWRAIPAQTAMIVELSDALTTWDKFTHTSQLWSALEEVPGIAASGKLIADLIAQRDTDEAFAESLNGVPVLVAIMRDGGERVGSLFIIAPRASNKNVLNSIARVLHADENALLNGQHVEVRPDTALPALSVRFANGLWTIASSANMLDGAEFQLGKKTSILEDSVLTKARRTLGSGTDAHVLVHTGRAQSLLSTWWTPNATENLDLPLGWVALDVSTRPEALLLSGLIVPERNEPVLNSLQEQGAAKFTLSRVLPASVSWLNAMEISDPQKFMQDRWGKELNDNAAASALLGWVKGTVTVARSYAPVSGEMRQWVVLRTNDPEAAFRSLQNQCNGACDSLNYRGSRLIHSTLASTYGTLLGSAYEMKEPWFTILGDAVLFSTDVDALRKSIDGWNDGNTLAENERALEWLQQFSAAAGRTVWCDVARSKSLVSKDLRSGPARSFAEYDTLWMRFGVLSMQLSPGQHSMQHIAIGLQHAPMQASGTRLLWSTAIGPLVERRPTILINHTNDTREVFLQGKDDEVHLLGSSGKLLWSRKIDGTILGEVHQVDRFNNGKLQLLFNTADRIYLIDRNGKDVGGFPLPLNSPTTAPLSVFDYDNNKDYRILIATANRKIQNFSMDGVAVKGWDPRKLEVASNEQVRHVRIKNKDYLIVIDGEGTIQLLDRRGEEREKSDLVLKGVRKVHELLPGLDLMNSTIYWTDTAGTVYQSKLSGTTEQLRSASKASVVLGTSTDDGQFDLITTIADSLIVTHAGKPVFTKTFGDAIGAGTSAMKVNGSAATIGVVIPSREQIYLINDRGYPLDEMPLQGSLPITVADLDRDGKQELITATSAGQVMVYQLNKK